MSALQKRIREVQNLADLVEALRSRQEEATDDDLADLPTFGGDPPPSGTAGVWSWDALSVLVGRGPIDEMEVVSREKWAAQFQSRCFWVPDGFRIDPRGADQADVLEVDDEGDTFVISLPCSTPTHVVATILKTIAKAKKDSQRYGRDAGAADLVEDLLDRVGLRNAAYRIARLEEQIQRLDDRTEEMRSGGDR